MANRNGIASAILSTSQGRGGSISALSPLAQSNSQGFDINRPYGNFLGRDPQTFQSGAMGPLSPIAPVGIDEPDEVSGRPAQRRFQYPVAWNLNMGQPGTEGLKLASYATLRQLADTYSIARTCVERRVQEVCSLDWDIVPTADAELKMYGDEELRDDWQNRKAKLRKFFERPDSDTAKYPDFATWLAALMEDVVVIDAVAVHLRPTRKPGAGIFGSSLAGLDLIDGSTIRPMLDIHGATPKPPNVAYQQYLWGVPRSDMLSMIEQTDIDQMDEPAKEFRSDQLLFLRHRPRAWTPYGYSMTEQVLLPISIGLARQQWQWDYYQEGSVPAQFITAGPDISTPQQVRQLQDALNGMAGDIGQKHRIIVLPPGSATKDQKEAMLADQFDAWLATTVTMGYGLNALDIGVIPQITSSISSIEIREMPGANSDPMAFKRLGEITGWLKSVLFDRIIQEVLGQEDMEFSWGLKGHPSETAEIVANHVQQVQYGLESVDEARLELSRAPWGIPETQTPMAWTASGPIPLSSLTSETGEADVRPWQSPTGSKPSDSDIQTPAQTAATGGKPQAKPGNAPKPDAASVKPDAKPQDSKKALEIELSVLGRYLRKGRSAAKFVPTVLPAEALTVAAQHEDPDEALEAIKAILA